MDSPSSPLTPPAEPTNHVDALNSSTPVTHSSGGRHDDTGHDTRSRHLQVEPLPLLSPFDDARDGVVPGIHRRRTLPVSSQVPTPQGSDDEDDDSGPGAIRGKSPSPKPTDSPPPSASREDSEGELYPDDARELMKKLDALVGLDDVKSQFRELGLYVHNSRVLRLKSTDDRFHALFQGNPGTGKTTVAKLYAKFLKSLGVLASDDLVETSGAKLATGGPSAVVDLFEDGDGGVLFVDEAYQLVSSHSSVAGKQILDVILGEMDRNHHDSDSDSDDSDSDQSNPQKWVVIFAGYKEEFEPFFAHNDGLSSRLPQILTFGDFSSDQLRNILLGFFAKRFSRHQFEIEGGTDGPFVGAVVRRITQGRGRRGFGNARTVRNHFQRICQRQARRLGQLVKPTIKQRLFFTKEDLLGPRPLDVKATSKAWAKLNSLIGLHEVKKSVDIMFRIVETNYQRELRGKRPHTHSLNRVFVGSPGTGKTTVANLYGQILAELGFLSKGDVVVKTPADLIGNAVGHSESNTRTILASTLGKVLIIDEAYMLDPGDATTTRDSFKTAVLDTIVAQVQGNPGDDRCVLLLGYEDKMQSLFQNGNPGLSGRFMADMPFRFADYSPDELRDILKLDLKARNIDYDPDSLKAAADMLSLLKYNRNFSNAREVKLLVSEAVLRNQERHMARGVQGEDGEDSETRLEAQDFDPWLRPQTAAMGNLVNIRSDLTDRISEPVIQQLERYFQSSLNRDLNRHVPRTFVFKGPASGTGKTTLAQYMGKLYRDIGLLPTNRAVLCEAVNFIGQHVGQTRPRTRMQLEQGFGRVLIIRDIHRLARGGYSNEALDEITSFIRAFSGRMAVVLTGPSDAVEGLLAEHHELGSLFPDQITFEDLSPRDCLKILDKQIKELEPAAKTPFFTSQAATERFEKAISIISMFEGWGNAPLVKFIKTRMIQKADAEHFLAASRDPARKHAWKLTEDIAMSCLRVLFHDVRNTGAAIRKVSEPSGTVAEPRTPDPAPQPGPPDDNPTQATSETVSEPKRVVHATQQLQSAAKEASPPASEEGSKKLDKKIAQQAATTKSTEKQMEKRDKNEKDDQDQNRSVQEAIKQLGKCEMGFDWHRVDGRWVCQGGQHSLSDAEVAAAMR
ncbi:P-loop containing nucleoside triphosphate hydrolase protein [Podospora conica]|nr:P-loop containing nucleoside triphosphate hydrolase protein [Schizothecium conicum]